MPKDHERADDQHARGAEHEDDRGPGVGSRRGGEDRAPDAEPDRRE